MALFALVMSPFIALWYLLSPMLWELFCFAVGNLYLFLFALLAFTTERALRKLSTGDQRKLELGTALLVSTGDNP